MKIKPPCIHAVWEKNINKGLNNSVVASSHEHCIIHHKYAVHIKLKLYSYKYTSIKNQRNNLIVQDRKNKWNRTIDLGEGDHQKVDRI